MRFFNQIPLIFILLLLLQTACTEQALEMEINNIGTIEGRVASSSAALSSDTQALTCATWTAHLFELTGTDDTWSQAPLSSTPVDDQGNFKFERLSSVNIRLKDLNKIKYVVVIEGCDKKFRRLITSAKGQNISPVSDLLLRTFHLLSRNGKTLNDLSQTEIHSLMSDLEAFEFSTLYDVYTKLTTDTAYSNRFTLLFGFAPTQLQYLPPQIKMGLNPTTAAENSNPNFLLSLSHWHPGYPKRALWYSGTKFLGEGETATLTIDKNLQGARTFTATAGYSNGPTSIDLTKPYSQESISVSVTDDFPVTAPLLTRTLPATAISTTRSLTLSIATGASLANCETLSSLALTEESLVPPFSPTAYTISCTTAPTQSLSYNLTSTGDGTKNLSLWAMDSSGNISLASTLLVPLDETAPNAPSLTRLSSAISNSVTVQIQNGNCNDNATHILFSESSTAPAANDINWQSCSAGNYNFNVATGDGAKTIYAFLKDAADHVSSPGSVTMTLDQTSPSVNLTGAPTLNQRVRGGSTSTLTWTASDTHLATTPIIIQISSNGGTSWTDSVTSLTNSGTHSWTVPNFTGSTFKVRIKAMDLAGNAGTSSGSPTFAIDSTAPNVSLTSLTGGQLLRGGSTVAITWTATDDQLATNPISIDYSSNSGTTWTSVASGLANTGTYNWTVPSVDGSNFRIRVTALDDVGMTGSAQSSSSFTIDSTLPLVTLLSLNGGQTIPGNQNHVISWTASDARLVTNPITLEYSANSGTSWTTIASGLSNSGSYTWNVAVADGAQYRIRVKAIDQVGNEANSVSSSDFNVSSAAPNLTQSTSAATIISNSLSQVTYGGNCETGLNISITGAETATVGCPAGTWTWTTASYSTDATRTFTFSQTNAATITTTVSVSWTRDTTAPQLSSVQINSGNATTASPLLNVEVTTLETNISVRLALAEGGTGNCQVKYADNNWDSHSSLTVTHLYSVPVGDGLKKICVWAKDAAGNVSVISPVTGTAGVDYDNINLETGTAPQITAFSVVNDETGLLNHAVGDRLRISWTITDTEGLPANPVTLDYTTDNGSTWTTIVSNYGGLSGNPTTYTHSYLAFNAPVSSAFRIRIRVMDTAGNSASPILSNIQNGGQWSIYAGSTDRGLGGEAKSLRLRGSYIGQFNNFAVSPVNGDIYIVNDNLEIIRVDRSSGLTSVFLKDGANNLPDDGTIPAQPTAPIYGCDRVLFDSNGKLYVMVPTTTSPYDSGLIYQFDLVQNRVRKYLGGGTAIDETSTATTAMVSQAGFAMDSSNTLYYFTYCTPGSFTAGTSTVRIMKVTQNPDGTAGTFSKVAGNCVRGTFVIGNLAVNEPISNTQSSNISLYGQIAVNTDGSVLYFRTYGTPLRKIFNSRIYTTAIGTQISDFSIDSYNNQVIISNGEVASYSINTTGANGEVKTVLAASNGTDADCWNDGKPASQACVYSQVGSKLGPDRLVYFVDNMPNAGGIFRIRYIDGNNTIRTAAGGKPVHGEGLSRDLIKVDFEGIYYKQSTEPNQSAFPAGLYFMSQTGAVLGHLDDNTPLSIVWGNQKAETAFHWLNNTPVNSQLSIGTPNTGSTLYPLTFDSDGLPWLKLNDALYSLNSSKQVVRKSDKDLSGYNALWDQASAGGDPRYFGMAYYAGIKNLVIKKNQGPFLMGRYYSPPTLPDQGIILRWHDFSSNTIQHIMGTSATTASSDSATPGSLAASSFLSTACLNTAPYCALQFEENDPLTVNDDELYFAESRSIRKIINPLTPAANELKTVFTQGTPIVNFILSPDKKYIFYIRNSSLSCHSIALADEKSWCKNNPAQHTSLGPPTGMNTLGYGPNQMTWRSSSRLLINTYKGEIYEYQLPP